MKRPLNDLMTVARYAVLHAVVTAAVWLGPLTYAGLGLGFKDKEKWSWLDQVISVIALPLANTLTTPGRYLSWDGAGGFLIPALVTSLCWGAVITVVVRVLKRSRLRRSQAI